MNRDYFFETKAADQISHMLDMKRAAPGMFREVIGQFMDMAQGGNGGPLHFDPGEEYIQQLVDSMQPVDKPVTIRSYNYPDHPDSYFKTVLRELSFSEGTDAS